MLDSRDAFKVGFLSRCVEDGLTLEATHQRVKEASEKLAGLLDLPGKMLELAKPVIGTTLGYGVPALLAAPPILGGLAGYTAAKAMDIGDEDVEEVKKRELLDEYKRQEAKLRREKTIRTYRAQRKRTGRVFL